MNESQIPLSSRLGRLAGQGLLLALKYAFLGLGLYIIIGVAIEEAKPTFEEKLEAQLKIKEWMNTRYTKELDKFAAEEKKASFAFWPDSLTASVRSSHPAPHGLYVHGVVKNTSDQIWERIKIRAEFLQNGQLVDETSYWYYRALRPGDSDSFVIHAGSESFPLRNHDKIELTVQAAWQVR